MIKTQSLSKSFLPSPFPDFVAESGDFVLIVGSTGSGKSTLCDIIAGFTPADTGSIFINGKDIKKCNPFESLHYLQQVPDHNLIGPTAEEEIKLWESTLPPLTEGGIADLPIWKLSFGQKKALALHCIYLIPRPIWLLDEPLAGLDRDAIEHTKAMMQAHLQTGGTIVATSHTEEAFAEFLIKSVYL